MSHLHKSLSFKLNGNSISISLQQHLCTTNIANFKAQARGHCICCEE